MRQVEIAPGVTLGGRDLVLIAGPCVIESEAHATGLARELAAIAKRAGQAAAKVQVEQKTVVPV